MGGEGRGFGRRMGGDWGIWRLGKEGGGTYATGKVTAVLTLDGDVFCAAERGVED